MRYQYQIKGMSCAACAYHVERAIKGEVGEGATVQVSLLTNSAAVVCEETDEAALTERLKKAVRSAGYELMGKDEESGGQEAKTGKIGAGRRLCFSICFTAALMAAAMIPMANLSDLPVFQRSVWNGLIQLILTVPVVVLNFRFFKSGIPAILRREPNMDSLVAVGAGAAVVYGSIALGVAAFGSEEAAREWLRGTYFESAAMILTLVSVGKTLEERAKRSAASAIRAMAALRPTEATVLRDGAESKIPVGEIVVGDLILLRVGDLVPADGSVTEGAGTVDESALTGESMPVDKTVGDRVRSACVVTGGAMTVRAESVGEDTSFARVVRLLEDAAASKAPIARIADRVGRVFVPVVMGIALVTFAVWLAVTGGDVLRASRAGIAVLVISCPCALGLATPTAITVGVGRGAGMGVLFRDAEAMETLGKIRTAVFDKTGTVTEGRPAVTDFIAYGTDEQALLAAAGAVERLSSHPLALAVAEAATDALGGGETALPTVADFVSEIGVGASGKVNGRIFSVGKYPDKIEEFFKNYEENPKKEDKNAVESHINENRFRVVRKPDPTDFRADFAALEEEGKTVVSILIDGVPSGLFALRDRVRAEAATTISALRAAGVSCRLLTGDNERTARAVGREVGFDAVRAGVLPEDKEAELRALARDREMSPVAMVGDGINDAPALLAADVGIAVGAGTEVAVDSAGIVLAGSSLRLVDTAYRLSRATVRIIKQNLFWALFYNALCIPLAAGAFYPLLGWQLDPMVASAAMSLSSVTVVLNALRLRRVRLDFPTKEGDTMFGKKTPATVSLAVDGMMCAHCVAHVKSALEGVRGVRSADVDLASASASVTTDGSVSVAALLAAVKSAGYEAKEKED